MRPLAVLLVVVLGCAPAARKQEVRKTTLCDPGDPGIETGALAIGGPDSSDAQATGRFALLTEGTCRRFTFALDGTRVGPVEGTFDRSYGVVRFPLPRGISTVTQADSAFGDSAVAAAYVVRERAGGHRLDVHLARPSFVRSRAHGSEIQVDLQPGGGAIPALAPRARNVVVMDPRDGGVTYPIVVRGYARTFEANVVGWVEQGDAVAPQSKAFTTAADWVGTWGEFELTIPGGPEGDIVLFVGEESAKDGTPVGVRIPLRATVGGR